MTEPILSMKINGLEELKAQLKALPLKTRQKISRKALRQIAEIMKQEAISRCPRQDGFLQASIRTKVSLKENFERAQIIAGNEKAWYAHLVEWGFTHTGPGKKPSDRVRPTKAGFIEGKAFLRNAAERQFENAVDIVQDVVAESVEKEIKKQNRLKR